MISFSFINLIVVLFGCATSQSILSTIQPCSLKDGACQTNLWNNAIPYMVQGVPEMKIPPMDPLGLHNITVGISNLFTVHLRKGVLKGYKNCTFTNSKTVINKGNINSTITVFCPAGILKGDTNITSKSSVIPLLNPNITITVDGITKMKFLEVGARGIPAKSLHRLLKDLGLPRSAIGTFMDRVSKMALTGSFSIWLSREGSELSADKLNVTMGLHGKIVKDEHGEIKTLVVPPNRYEYTLGRVIFYAKNISLGEEDITAPVLNFMNGNWKMIMDLYGHVIFKKAFQINDGLLKKFFKNSPAKTFLSNDLQEYL